MHLLLNYFILISSITFCAYSFASEVKISKSINKHFPKYVIDYTKPSNIPGYYEIKFKNFPHVNLVSEDGQFIIVSKNRGLTDSSSLNVRLLDELYNKRPMSQTMKNIYSLKDKSRPLSSTEALKRLNYSHNLREKLDQEKSDYYNNFRNKVSSMSEKEAVRFAINEYIKYVDKYLDKSNIDIGKVSKSELLNYYTVEVNSSVYFVHRNAEHLFPFVNFLEIYDLRK